MKKFTLLYTIFTLFFCSISYGQNSFPASGTVGIGTLNPDSNYALDVSGAINATEINVTSLLVGGNPMQSSPWNLNGSNVSYSAGNVGIGTNTPNYELDVVGTFNATNIFVNGTEIVPSPWAISGNDLSYITGNVGIGTSNTQGYMLAVAGNVVAEAVKVELESNWPDFVFEKDYNLQSLREIETYIKKYGHLPNVPSADEIKNDGINLGEMDATLLQKIEELTLHSIQQQKEIDSLKVLNNKLHEQNQLILSLHERLLKIESKKAP